MRDQRRLNNKHTVNSSGNKYNERAGLHTYKKRGFETFKKVR